MTFTQIVQEVMDRLNLTSPDAETRIGRNVNVRYKRVTSAIGLQSARRVLVQADASLGSRYLTFTGIEKVIEVSDRSTGRIRVLDEVTVEEINAASVGDGLPTMYAVYRMNAGSVQVYLNVNPQSEFTLYAEGMDRADTLAGSDEPAFSESFHDVLVEGAIADEYRKQEKRGDAADAEALAENRLSDLRMWIAKSAMQDIYQGKRKTASLGGGTSGGSGGGQGSTSYSQTGLVTFDRSSAAPDDAPFAVAAGANKVDNLDADLLDGEEAADFHDASQLTGALPVGMDGSGLTDLNADELTSGTIPDGRFPATLPAVSGANLTNLDASDLASGTVPDARFPATLPAASGVNLTALNATQLTSGAIPVGRHSDPFVCNGRLTLTTGTPVTTGDVTGATTIYFTPYKGNRLALYDGSTRWNTYAFTELSLALGTLTADRPYDVFVYDNAGTPTLEFLVWTSATVRATALTTQDGVLVKTGATTRRYLGTFHTTATTTTEDSAAKRLLWNYYNRVRRNIVVKHSGTTYTYTTDTWRQANADSANQSAVVVGVAEAEMSLRLNVSVRGETTPGSILRVGFGEDSTSAPVANQIIAIANSQVVDMLTTVSAHLEKYPAVGYHFYASLERASATGTVRWWGNNGDSTLQQTGQTGTIEG